MGRPAIRALPDSPAAGDAAPTAQHGAAEQRGIPGRPCGAQSFGAHGAWEMDGLWPYLIGGTIKNGDFPTKKTVIFHSYMG
jgi:hypothetical protein